ncbi:hypothetical protein C8R44DRAFT_859013 [Mycena epipterygia]|nr:hypothetical protein C8R44DRAFT_859013 [Mycena epipterygia]
MPVKLATIHLDTQLEISSWIPDFTSLHSCVLRRYSGPKHRGYKSKLICQLLSNERVLQEVQFIVFRLLLNKYKRMSEWNTEFRSPTPPKLSRFKRAAYRFWIYCMIETNKRTWFLSQFPAIEITEITNLFYGVEAWILVRNRGRCLASRWQFRATAMVKAFFTTNCTNVGSKRASTSTRSSPFWTRDMNGWKASWSEYDSKAEEIEQSTYAIEEPTIRVDPSSTHNIFHRGLQFNGIRSAVFD